MDRHRFRMLLGALCIFGAIPAMQARGAVDASGAWFAVIELLPGIELSRCHVDVVQANATLETSVTCDILFSFEASGSVDVSSGEFLVTSSSVDPICGAAISLDGVIAADGRTFEAAINCPGAPFPLRMIGTRCGNGAVDAGESCDDGNRLDGDCCSSTCTADAPGARCEETDPCRASTCDGAGSCTAAFVAGPCDDGNTCTDADVCTAGTCTGTARPAFSSCDDQDDCTGDGLCVNDFCLEGPPVQCGPCEACSPGEGCVSGPSFDCTSAGPTRLLLRDHPNDGRDAARLHMALGSLGYVGGPAAFGDPRDDTGYAVCVFEDLGFGRLLAKMEIPAGGQCQDSPCWTPTPRGYRYVDASATHDGVRSLLLRADARGKGFVSLQATGPALDPATLPASLDLPTLVQVQGSNGFCQEQVFDDAKQNNPIQLQVRSPRGE